MRVNVIRCPENWTTNPEIWTALMRRLKIKRNDLKLLNLLLMIIRLIPREQSKKLDKVYRNLDKQAGKRRKSRLPTGGTM